jgi:hypothetical protein
VIVVSEETGVVSLAIGGELRRGLDAQQLQGELERLFNVRRREAA